MSNLYNFNKQLAVGVAGEDRLDKFFRKWYSITPASMAMQRQGIDRIFRRGGEPIKVEYKTDTKTVKTGNLFIETDNKGIHNKAGWLTASHAEIVAFYLPGLEKVIIFRLKEARSHLHEWQAKYQLKSIRNQGWITYGYPVPLTEFAFAKIYQL